ncbi:MAG: trypsin-like peptidase domain-containing protein, partial [Arenicellales bacterium]|nr:trypsin-like peptidase domain-containing protein [Arenicellales bacterium]
ELEVTGDSEVWINGVRVTENRVLESGDLLELGHTGPVLRFRLYPPGVLPKKSLAEALADSLDGARADGRSNIGKAGWFFTRFAHDLATQTTAWFRVWVLVLITLLILSIVVLVVQHYRFQKQLSTEAVRIDAIAKALEQTGAEAMKKEDLVELQKEVESQLAEAVQRVETLEARSDVLARIIAAVEGSIAFVQGAYGFVDPDSGKPLRYIEPEEGIYLFTLDERGSIVELSFTGTAFVISGQHVLLTNKHVAQPWLADERAEVPKEHDLEPVIIKMRVFFPGIKESVKVEHLTSATDADLALLQVGQDLQDINVLELEVTKPKPGDEVLVVGYPLGMSGMLARVSPKFMEEITPDSEVDIWMVGDRLSEAGYIKPLASRGIVSQLSDNYIVYDAETAFGGSGAPVLDLNGKVVGINTAIVEGFGGSNLGILSVYAQELLIEAAEEQ